MGAIHKVRTLERGEGGLTKSVCLILKMHTKGWESVQLIAHINKMIKLSYGRNLKRPECLNDSENNLVTKCSNKNCTIPGNLSVFRHCTRCSTYFCNQFCDVSEKIIKLLNERSDNYWFFPGCTKPALHAVFVEKDVEERCQIFFETIEKRIKKIEEDHTSIFSSLETVMKNNEDRNITIRNKLDKLEDRIDSCKRQIFIQQSSTNKSDENQMLDSELAYNNTQEPLMLIKQLKDGKSRQKSESESESELVNNDDIAADKLRKYQQSIAKQCDVKIDDNSVLKLHRLGKKQELSSKPRPLVVTFPNSYLRNKLIKKAFKLKYVMRCAIW